MGRYRCVVVFVCALLEGNDQLRAPTAILPLAKPRSVSSTEQDTGHG